MAVHLQIKDYRTERTMSDSSITSLAERASVAVISSLWNRDDVISDIKQYIFDTYSPDPWDTYSFDPSDTTAQNFKRWMDIENKVISLLHDIELPKRLKSILINLVQPMGIQIVKWIQITQLSIVICRDLPESIRFQFNEKGILDYAETAKLIIESSSDHLLCYFLACIFFMEETILKCWPHVECFFNETNCTDLEAMGSKAAIYWTIYLRGEISDYSLAARRNHHEFGFLYLLTAKCVCVASLEHFMKFIPPERRKELVTEAFQDLTSRIYYDGNVVIYLLSLLTKSEANRIIENKSSFFLCTMLQWTCHEHFMNIANVTFNTLEPQNFSEFLDIFIDFAVRYHLCDAYKTLFQQFWISSPLHLRQYIMRSALERGTWFLMRLLLRENTAEIAQIILESCAPEVKKEMIFSAEGMKLCDLLNQKRDNRASLKLFVTNCIPDKSTLHKFIEENKKCFFANCEIDKRSAVMYEKMKEWY